jgi:hypothetical protein
VNGSQIVPILAVLVIALAGLSWRRKGSPPPSVWVRTLLVVLILAVLVLLALLLAGSFGLGGGSAR